MKHYAQIDRKTNVVNLIGTENEGMPINNHPLVYTLEITDRPDFQNIKVNMAYILETDSFSEYVPEPIILEPTESEIILARLDYLTMLVEPMEVV